MSEQVVTLSGGVALLERAVGYTLGALSLVRPGAMGHPTPCPAWDLRALLAHLSDSLQAIQEAGDVGDVGLAGSREPVGAWADPVAALRGRACAMIGAWAGAPGSPLVSVGGVPVPSGLVTGAGAIEVAVHGWDVSVACGHERAIPQLLAEELLACSFLLVLDRDRPQRFAPPVEVSAWAPATDRLLAYLGRRR